jgi:uncharacterized hydrophobic protein (TIGR00271 family)
MEEHKFNFSEEEKHTDESVAKSKEAVKQDAKGLFDSIKHFLIELLDFRQDTDRDATMDAIKGDVSFKGATAWILICSIFVASIGLNANSTAVVIGAMLISPLMGPILGVGMSIAINDVDTLRKSLINLVTMIVLSLLTAFLFFKFFPLSEDTSELLGRTQPDIRDVLIAFFGGLALIIARTKRGTIASVIFGVAIATALMPPLCTAGYGLAKANWQYFGGAMYLFTINTIFIALATFLVLKLLRFPMIKYANSKKRKRIGNIATVLAIIVMIPASLTFWDVLKESQFKADAKSFINTELKGLPNEKYIIKNATYDYRPDATSVIEITTFGSDEISNDTEAILRSRLSNYKMLKDAKLFVNQANFKGLDNLEYMEELRSRDSLDLLSKSEKIRILEDRVRMLSKLERDQIPFEQVAEELRLNYDNIQTFSYAKEITSNYKRIDTLPVFLLKWNKELVTKESIEKDTKKIENWLKYKLDLDTLIVKQQE